MIIETIPDIQRLTAREKAILVQELWADLGDQGFQVSGDSDHVDLLDQRWSAFLSAPESSSPWTEVKRKIEDRFCL